MLLLFLVLRLAHTTTPPPLPAHTHTRAHSRTRTFTHTYSRIFTQNTQNTQNAKNTEPHTHTLIRTRIRLDDDECAQTTTTTKSHIKQQQTNHKQHLQQGALNWTSFGGSWITCNANWKQSVDSTQTLSAAWWSHSSGCKVPQYALHSTHSRSTQYTVYRIQECRFRHNACSRHNIECTTQDVQYAPYMQRNPNKRKTPAPTTTNPEEQRNTAHTARYRAVMAILRAQIILCANATETVTV